MPPLPHTPSYIQWTLYINVSFQVVLEPKFHVHFSSLTRVLHIPPISFTLRGENFTKSPSNAQTNEVSSRL
jgi:hypothetical protein